VDTGQKEGKLSWKIRSRADYDAARQGVRKTSGENASRKDKSAVLPNVSGSIAGKQWKQTESTTAPVVLA